MGNRGKILCLLLLLALCIPGSAAFAIVDYQYLLSGHNTPTTDPPTPVTVTATSQYSGREGYKACNNSGMTGTQNPQDRHRQTVGDMWMSAQNPTYPELDIDLGDVYALGKMPIWNYNESGQTDRGFRYCYIQYSVDGINWSTLDGGQGYGGLWQLAQASTAALAPASNAVGGAVVDFRGAAGRYVKIWAASNWGDTGPYYGLSEVRIYRHASNVTSSAKYIAAKPLQWSSQAIGGEVPNTTNNRHMSDNGTGSYGSGATINNAVGQWWTTANNPDPYIMFDLGGTYPLDRMYVWNYNVNYGGSCAGRGIKNCRIFYAVNNPGYNPAYSFAGWTQLGGTQQLAIASGNSGQAATSNFAFSNAMARYVMIVPNVGLNDGNWGGVQPADGSNVHYGLGQVRFIAGTGTVVEPAPYLTGLVGQRSQSGAIWGGADGNHSIPYTGPGGAARSLFTYSDTYNDTWNPVTYERPDGWFEYNNSNGVYSGGATLTPPVSSMVLDTAHAIIPSSWPNHYYWLNGGVYIANQNKIFVQGIRVPSGQVNSVADHLIALPLSSGVIQWASQTQYDTGHFYHNAATTTTLSFSSFMMDRTAQDGYIYIYGAKTYPNPDQGGPFKTLNAGIVARVQPASITTFSAWRFYNGSSWVQGSTNAAPISFNNHTCFTPAVTPARDAAHSGQFMMVMRELVIGDILVSYAANPYGPFNTWTKVFAIPDGGVDTYNGGCWSYGATPHPELSLSNEMIMSYCLNATSDLYGLNADLYHPRFIRMRNI